MKCNILFHISICIEWLQTRFGLVTKLTEYLLIITTINYTTLTNSCAHLLTTAHTKSSQFVFTSRFLIMDSNDVLYLHPCCMVNVSQLTKSLNNEIISLHHASSTTLHCGHFTSNSYSFDWLQFNQPALDLSCLLNLDMDRVWNTAPHCCSHFAMKAYLLAKPLLSNGCCIPAYSTVVA
jgi:hypothetical protein